MWRPGLNVTYDGNNGFSLNVSVPDLEGSIRAVREDLYVIGGTSGMNRVDEPLELGNLWALSLEKGHEGELLWNFTYTPPYDEIPSVIPASMYRGHVYGPTVDPEDGVFLFEESISGRRWGYDLETGQLLWGPTEPEPAMNFYGMYDNIYQGKLFSFGYGGTLIAYNITTGDVLWTYIAENVGYESPYGNYPIFVTAIADGKIYLATGEHSPTQPLMRGPNLRCIDAETGDEVWKVSFYGSGDGGGHLQSVMVVIADGHVVGLNYYDNQIYCFGKGPSATTVTGPDTVVPLGTTVLIKGTVTD